MSSKRAAFFFLSALLLCAAGCAAVFSQNDRYAAADRVADRAGFEKSFIRTSSFTLTAFTRFTKKGDPLHVYIEGDGAAWLSRTRLSDDPTPQSPLVLELAALDPTSNVAYLARPGQYAADGVPDCDAAYWSDRRFSDEVVEAMSRGVDELRKRAGAGEIHLVGYSGGAAIAVLVAARRIDVVSLRTVAGNLDPDAVNRHHRVSPFMDAKNPMNVAAKLRNLPQRHFVGSQDTVIPSGIARSFLKRSGRRDLSAITIVEGATHTRGWRERWKDLLVIPLNE
jgi:pimeloyl-ACP methyl ester carboxylesterase